ncbi:geranylgeranyl transferase type-1 subunit beta [[Candida] jaroonii]|uniref:Geranylgeranyl transferase type-1 subunit beta n=1 Tax=[Candida] jaroonii TaxID=467808 RepID=A0ACA9Y346_9ASCO|nr:geranylgeranyl transferase type-1 subunit beta [[Candida] jaroonii]
MSELSIDINKHIKYFTLCLNVLPSKYQDQDNNKLSLIYFCLQSLEILNDLKFNETEKGQFSKFIYDCYYTGNGFRSIMNSMGEKYEKPSISSTFFAITNLITLQSPINQHLDRFKIMDFLKDCQIKSGNDKGSFAPTIDGENQPFGDNDLRICYMAVCIRKYLKIDELPPSQMKDVDFSVIELEEYILRRLNYNGGFSCYQMSESHLGYTYCAIASLKLLDFDFSKINFDKTLNWILHRQVNYPDILYDQEAVNHEDFGGFNGRENKPSDTCYSWWSLGSLSILEDVKLANLPKISSYLLMNQDRRTGGFGKNFDSSSDPYHSFLALSSLALIKDSVEFIGKDELSEFDGTMSITKSSVDFCQSLTWPSL